MRKLLLAALLGGAALAPLAAQNTPAPAQTPQPGNTPADRARGGVIFRTFSVAINSDQVDAQVKNRLFACLYTNPIRNLSVATGRVFERNSNLDARSPQQVYAVAAQICGVRPGDNNAAGGATPTPSPAPSGR